MILNANAKNTNKRVALKDKIAVRIMKEETYQSTKYRDGVGWSVGYGHYLSQKELKNGMVYNKPFIPLMSKENAKYVLYKDLGKIQRRLWRNGIKLDKLNDQQKIEIFDYIYNCGLTKGMRAALIDLTKAEYASIFLLNRIHGEFDCILSNGKILKGLVKRRARNQYGFRGFIAPHIKKYLTKEEIKEIKER